jgi:hypothetical protein
MLEMSEADIQNGRTISQNDLDKNDLEWLKGKQSRLKLQPNSVVKYYDFGQKKTGAQLMQRN